MWNRPRAAMRKCDKYIEVEFGDIPFSNEIEHTQILKW